MKNQYLRVVFTVNLAPGADWQPEDMQSVRTRLNPVYFVAGKETAPSTGQKHWQGFFVLGKKMLGNKIDKLFRTKFPLPISVHFESARGTNKQASDYCKKTDEEAYEDGELPPEADRTGNVGALMQLIKNGASDVELAEQDPQTWAQYRKGLAEYRSLTAPKRDWVTNVIIIYGKTGTGKTREAMKLSPDSVFYSRGFINGYFGQEVVLFDDFQWDTMPIQVWLRLCDRYPCTMEIKGGQVNWAPRTVIFTSNEHPDEWWPKASEMHREAFQRRITETIALSEKFDSENKSLLTSYFRKASAASAPTVTTSATAPGATAGCDATSAPSTGPIAAPGVSDMASAGGASKTAAPDAKVFKECANCQLLLHDCICEYDSQLSDVELTTRKRRHDREYEAFLKKCKGKCRQCGDERWRCPCYTFTVRP